MLQIHYLDRIEKTLWGGNQMLKMEMQILYKDLESQQM